MAAEAWRLRHIVTLDEYLEQAIHAPWMGLLLPRGTSRYEELRRAGELCSTRIASEPEVEDADQAPRRRAKSAPGAASTA